MKKLFMIFAFLTFIANSEALARFYLIPMGGGCFEVWSGEPENGGDYLGIGCTGIEKRNSGNNTQARVSRKKKSPNKAPEIVSIIPNSEIGKLILGQNKKANLKDVVLMPAGTKSPNGKGKSKNHNNG